jgi:transposase-like protein
MRQSRFTEEQIIAGLKEAEAGVKVREICRKQGICEPTYYRWKAKYGGAGGERGATNSAATTGDSVGDGHGDGGRQGCDRAAGA